MQMLNGVDLQSQKILFTLTENEITFDAQTNIHTNTISHTNSR